MSEWKEGTLDEVLNVVMGQSPKGDTCNSEGIGLPLLYGPTEFGIKCPTPVQFTTDAKRVSEVGDILFCVRGSTTGRMNWADQPYAIGRGIAAIQHKEGNEFSAFGRALIDYNLPLLLSSSTGSTFPNVSRSQLEKLEILIPPIEEQDDKIDLLHRQNQTLEQMAETLFRQWFMEEADGSWEEGVLGDWVEVKYGKDHKKLLDGQVPVYGSGGFMRAVDRPLFEGESVLIPRKGTLNNVMYVDEAFWTVDTMFYTIMRRTHLAKFVYQFIKQKDLASMNVGSAVPSMTTAVLNNMPIEIPPNDLLEKFDRVVSEFYNKIKSNQTQIQTLTALRDTMLPKLMSGEVRVAFYEKQLVNDRSNR